MRNILKDIAITMKLPLEFPLDGTTEEKEMILGEIMKYVECELRTQLECPSLPHTAPLVSLN